MANQQYLVNFIPILRFHFTIRYMTKEALRKMIKEYQFWAEGCFTPCPLKGVVGGNKRIVMKRRIQGQKYG
jgi:hypothetical protein